MTRIALACAGTLFTFSMTALGAALVFLMRGGVSARAQRLCMGFAAGVMSAAAVFSLLLPGAEQARALGQTPWLVLTAGLLLGAGVMALCDLLLRRLRRMRAADSASRKRALMLAAVTLHNIPEGMAVALAFALGADSPGGLAAATALALGIGLQNLPEGAAVSLPLRQAGMGRGHSFALGALSGAVEPLFGVAAVLAARAMQPAMPLLMALASGAMMLVVIGDMIPDAAQDRLGVSALMAGYALMMALDLGLG